MNKNKNKKIYIYVMLLAKRESRDTQEIAGIAGIILGLSCY
jgi:hypothetical protein